MVKFTKAMGYARRFGLSRDDRLAFAEVLLWRDVASWKDLSEEDLVRVLDAFEGYVLITFLHTGGDLATLRPGGDVGQSADAKDPAH